MREERKKNCVKISDQMSFLFLNVLNSKKLRNSKKRNRLERELKKVNNFKKAEIAYFTLSLLIKIHRTDCWHIDFKDFNNL